MLSESEIAEGRFVRQKLREGIAPKHIYDELAKTRPISTRQTWKDAILNSLGRKCAGCGAIDRLHLDHILPLAKGGSHKLENLQILCLECHRIKTKNDGYANVSRHLI